MTSEHTIETYNETGLEKNTLKLEHNNEENFVYLRINDDRPRKFNKPELIQLLRKIEQ